MFQLTTRIPRQQYTPQPGADAGPRRTNRPDSARLRCFRPPHISLDIDLSRTPWTQPNSHLPDAWDYLLPTCKQQHSRACEARRLWSSEVSYLTSIAGRHAHSESTASEAHPRTLFVRLSPKLPASSS